MVRKTHTLSRESITIFFCHQCPFLFFTRPGSRVTDGLARYNDLKPSLFFTP